MWGIRSVYSVVCKFAVIKRNKFDIHKCKASFDAASFYSWNKLVVKPYSGRSTLGPVRCPIHHKGSLMRLVVELCGLFHGSMQKLLWKLLHKIMLQTSSLPSMLRRKWRLCRALSIYWNYLCYCIALSIYCNYLGWFVFLKSWQHLISVAMMCFSAVFCPEHGRCLHQV